LKIALHTARALCAMGIVSLFTLFLAAAQPHRVHHLLENLPAVEHAHLAGAAHTGQSHSHVHGGSSAPLHAHSDRPDANHDGRPKTDCVTQGIVKHAHLVSNQSHNIVSCARVFSHWRIAISRSLSHSSHSSIGPRAPPLPL